MVNEICVNMLLRKLFSSPYAIGGGLLNSYVVSL